METLRKKPVRMLNYLFYYKIPIRSYYTIFSVIINKNPPLTVYKPVKDPKYFASFSSSSACGQALLKCRAEAACFCPAEVE